MRRNGTLSSFTDFIRNNAVTITLQVVGFLVVVANLWLASKLSPVVKDIDTVADKVNAIEETLEDRPELVQRFVVTEERVGQVDKSLAEIRKWQDRVEDKIDRIIERL